MNIKEIVNDPVWQALRESLLGTWRKNAAANVVKLRIYLGAEDKDFQLRRRRVHNYLTGSAFRIGLIEHPDIDQLLSEVREKK